MDAAQTAAGTPAASKVEAGPPIPASVGATSATGDGNTAGTPPKVDSGVTPPTSPPPAPAGAGKADVTANSINGIGQAFGTINIHTSDSSRSAAPTPWEDELSTVVRVPEPGHPVCVDELERQVEALVGRRLLLVRHAPNRRKEAVAAMRAVVHRVARGDPHRPVFNSGAGSPLQLHSLCGMTDWREDRRNAVLYLDRSDDPVALTFFNQIEKVDKLCEKLAAMGSHLVFTVVEPAGTELRDEDELKHRIAMWSFEDEQRSAPRELAGIFSGLFEVKLAVCASLFPGLSVNEFISIANTLAPPPEASPPAVAATGEETGRRKDDRPIPAPAVPLTRHERWSKGERDAVLAELGIELCSTPHGDGAEARTSEPGMFFADPVLRAEMPSWLNSRYPILVSQQLDTLTRHYLSLAASHRFCMGYRRLVLRMDTVGAQRLTTEWLLRHFMASLDGDPRVLLAQRFSELFAELPERADGDPLVAAFIDGIAGRLQEWEVSLIKQLEREGVLALAGEQSLAPTTELFWSTLLDQPAARSAIEPILHRQATVIDLLLSLAIRAHVDVARALARALEDCNAAHETWTRDAGLVDEGQPFVSLARAVFCSMQGRVLGQSPDQWLALVDAIGRTDAPTADTSSDVDRVRCVRTGRWLAWDCVHAFASMFDESTGALKSVVLRAALLNNDRPRVIGQTLAILLRMTAPPHWLDQDGKRQPEGPFVAVRFALWLFQSLVGVAMTHEGFDAAQAASAIAHFVGPWRDALQPLQRLEVMEVGSRGLDAAFVIRDSLQPSGAQHNRLPAARREHTLRIQALQSVLRALRQGSVQNPSQPATRRA